MVHEVFRGFPLKRMVDVRGSVPIVGVDTTANRVPRFSHPGIFRFQPKTTSSHSNEIPNVPESSTQSSTEIDNKFSALEDVAPDGPSDWEDIPPPTPPRSPTLASAEEVDPPMEAKQMFTLPFTKLGGPKSSKSKKPKSFKTSHHTDEILDIVDVSTLDALPSSAALLGVTHSHNSKRRALSSRAQNSQQVQPHGTSTFTASGCVNLIQLAATQTEIDTVFDCPTQHTSAGFNWTSDEIHALFHS